MKKEVLINNLQKAVKSLENADLPAEVTGIYAFGSILREKENPHDLDLVVLYEMTPEQTIRWEAFQRNFSNGYGADNSMNLIEKKLAPFRARGDTLRNAVKDKEVSNILRRYGIDPAWAGCFSWTSVFGYNPFGFYPSIDVVLHRMIFGRAKGFQVNYREGRFLPENKIPMIVAKNHCLAWSKEKPNVRENLFLGRVVEQRKAHDAKELDHFLNDEIPRDREEFMKAIDEVREKVRQKKILIELENLVKGHSEILRSGEESLSDLSLKCEQARQEMKSYKNETAVLRIILYCDNSIEGYSVEEYLSHCVIQGSRRRGLSEPEVRAILRTLKLPEDRIVTIKKLDFGTRYELAKNEKERDQLLVEASEESKLSRLHKIVTSVVRKYEQRASGSFQPIENHKPMGLTVSVFMYTEQLDNNEIRAIEKQLSQKSFEVRKNSWYLESRKYVRLQGSETKEELIEIAKKLVS